MEWWPALVFMALGLLQLVISVKEKSVPGEVVILEFSREEETLEFLVRRLFWRLRRQGGHYTVVITSGSSGAQSAKILECLKRQGFDFISLDPKRPDFIDTLRRLAAGRKVRWQVPACS